MRNHYIKGKVQKVISSSNKNYILLTSVESFGDYISVSFSDSKIVNEISKDMIIVVSGILQKGDNLVEVKNAKLETGEFKKVEKLNSSIKNPFNVKDIVKIFESRPFSKKKRWEVMNK